MPMSAMFVGGRRRMQFFFVGAFSTTSKNKRVISRVCPQRCLSILSFTKKPMDNGRALILNDARDGGGGGAFDRRSFYTLDDLTPASDDEHEPRRPIPPTLDSMLEDEGFGAYDYYDDEPDDIDYDDLQKQLIKEQEQALASSGSLPPPAAATKGSSNEDPLAAGERGTKPGKKTSSLHQTQSQENSISTTKQDAVDKTASLFEDIEVIPPNVQKRHVPSTPDDLSDFFAKASTGNGVTSNLDVLKLQCNDLLKSIYIQNNDQEFNLNSPRQVSQVLYGIPDASTKKEVLEGMAGGGNRMAELILQYRSLQQQIKRLTRKQESIQQGTRVKSASTVIVRGRNNNDDNDNVTDSSRGATNDETVIEGDPVILVDASNYIFRAYYSMPPIHRADGLPTGATLGFCNMLNRLVLNRALNGEAPRVILVFDSQGKNFRHDLYSQYKANRQAAPMDLIPQFQLVRQAATAYGIPQVEAPNYEADDVIATLAQMARNEGIDANILSGDKDLMQLVTDEGIEPVVNMIDPGKMERITVREVVNKWGVKPEKLGDVLALAGDAVDNVPGVAGIGPKTAALLIEEYGSLDVLLQNVDNIKQQGRRTKLQNNIDLAKLSRVLVDLDRGVPIESMTLPQGVDKIEDLRMEPLDSDRLLEFYDQMGFRDLKRRVKSRLDGIKRKRSQSKYSQKVKVEVPKPDEYKDVPF